MTIMVGSETEGGSSQSITIEKGFVTKRSALHTGKVAKMALKVPATNKAEKWRLGIFSAASAKPSTLLSETGVITIAKETATTVEGTLEAEVAVTEGTEYFLGILPTGANGLVFCTEKANFGFKSTLAITELNKGVYTSGFPKFGEPAPVWGIGSEEGAVAVAGTTKVRLKGEKLGAEALLSISSKAPVAVSFKTAGEVQSPATPVAGSSKVSFATQKAAATVKLGAAGSSAIIIKTKGAVTAGTEGGGRPSVFVFEE